MPHCLLNMSMGLFVTLQDGWEKGLLLPEIIFSLPTDCKNVIKIGHRTGIKNEISARTLQKKLGLYSYSSIKFVLRKFRKKENTIVPKFSHLQLKW